MKHLLSLLIFLSALASNAQLENVIKIKISGNNYSDETIVRFLPNATPLFDGASDAFKIISSNPNVPSLYSKDVADNMYSINAIPSLCLSDTSIDLYTLIPQDGLYTIDFIILGVFDSGVVLTADIDNLGIISLASDTSVQINMTAQPIENSPLSIATKINAPQSINVFESFTHPSCDYSTDGSISFGSIGAPTSLIITDQYNTIIYTVSDVLPQYTINNLSSGAYTFEYTSSTTQHFETVLLSPITSLNAQITSPAGIIITEVDSLNTFQSNLNNGESVEWVFGDGNFEYTTNAQHSFEIAGNYIVKLNAWRNGCSSTDSVLVQVEPIEFNSIKANGNINKPQFIYSENGGLNLLNRASLGKINSIAVYDLNGRLQANILNTDAAQLMAFSDRIIVVLAVIDGNVYSQKLGGL